MILATYEQIEEEILGWINWSGELGMTTDDLVYVTTRDLREAGYFVDQERVSAVVLGMLHISSSHVEDTIQQWEGRL